MERNVCVNRFFHFALKHLISNTVRCFWCILSNCLYEMKIVANKKFRRRIGGKDVDSMKLFILLLFCCL
jgi:hypothetical protein